MDVKSLSIIAAWNHCTSLFIIRLQQPQSNSELSSQRDRVGQYEELERLLLQRIRSLENQSLDAMREQAALLAENNHLKRKLDDQQAKTKKKRRRATPAADDDAKRYQAIDST